MDFFEFKAMVDRCFKPPFFDSYSVSGDSRDDFDFRANTTFLPLGFKFHVEYEEVLVGGIKQFRLIYPDPDGSNTLVTERFFAATALEIRLIYFCQELAAVADEIQVHQEVSRKLLREAIKRSKIKEVQN